MKKNATKILCEIGLTALAAVVSAFTLHVFVYNNGFAPSGVDGIATMLQQLTEWSAGIYYMILNIPLLIIALFFLDKKYVVYTVLFTVLSSGLIMLLGTVGFYQYAAENERLMAAIFSGLLLGIRTGIMIRIGASTGGVDIIACIIHKKSTYVHVERIIAILCYIIIGLSFFVYHSINSVLLSVVQMFVFEWGVNLIMKDSRDAIEFKIVTDSPEGLKNDIINKLKHGATVVESKGMYTDQASHIIISIVNSRQVPEFLRIIKEYPNTFVYYSKVMGVRGNFRWRKSDDVK